MKTIIIVPAYNEEKTLQSVLDDLKENKYTDIVVGDDGSVDKTHEIAKDNKVFVYRHIVNRGLGANLGTGFKIAQKLGADIAVTFDADGQHLAKDIKNLIKPILEKEADVVIGNRLVNFRKMPVDRLIVSLLASIVTFILYGVWFTDSQSGLRAFNRKALDEIQIKTRRMEVSSEILKEVKRNNLKLVSIPIDPIYTKYSRSKNDNKSNLNAFAVGIKMLLRVFR